MALSASLINRLELHFSGNETPEERREFGQLLDENPELAQAYIARRLEGDAYASWSGIYSIQLARQFEAMKEEDRFFSSQLPKEAADDLAFIRQIAEEDGDLLPITPPPIPPVQVPPPVPPRPNWLTELRRQLTEWGDTIAGTIRTAVQPQSFRLAYVLPVSLVFALGLGGRWYWLDQQDQRNLAIIGDQFGNPGHTAGSEATACDPALENAFSVYTSVTPADTINSRIERLHQLTNVSETCRAYYLGRAHIWKRDYKQAETLLQKARTSTEPLMQEQATYDLALCYVLMDEKPKTTEVLNSRSNWSSPALAETVKALNELAQKP